MTTTAATRRKRGLRSSEDGATAVEAALVLSIFVGVVLTIIDFAQAFFIWNTLQLVVGQTSRNVIVQNGIPGSALRHDLRRNCTADGDLTLARRQLGVDLQHADSGAILRERHLQPEQLQLDDVDTRQ